MTSAVTETVAGAGTGANRPSRYRSVSRRTSTPINGTGAPVNHARQHRQSGFYPNPTSPTNLALPSVSRSRSRSRSRSPSPAASPSSQPSQTLAVPTRPRSRSVESRTAEPFPGRNGSSNNEFGGSPHGLIHRFVSARNGDEGSYYGTATSMFRPQGLVQQAGRVDVPGPNPFSVTTRPRSRSHNSAAAAYCHPSERFHAGPPPRPLSPPRHHHHHHNHHLRRPAPPPPSPPPPYCETGPLISVLGSHGHGHGHEHRYDHEPMSPVHSPHQHHPPHLHDHHHDRLGPRRRPPPPPPYREPEEMHVPGYAHEGHPGHGAGVVEGILIEI